MTQITQDCRGVIDLSQPPIGYTKEDMDKLKLRTYRIMQNRELLKIVPYITKVSYQ